MKTGLFMTMAAAALMLAGCSNDGNEMMDNWNGEIRLSSGVTVTQTRAASGTVPDTQIADGQEVGVFINDASLADAPNYAVGNNLKYTANGSGGLILATGQETPYYPATGNGVNIWAYQPYDEDAAMTGDGFTFAVQTDQNADNVNYYNSDLLYSFRAEVYQRQAGAHSLSFEHKLSKVVCKLERGNGAPTVSGATVEIVNAVTNGTFKPADGSFTMAAIGNATTSDITMNSQITQNEYIAVIPPQTFTKGTQFLKITLSKDNGGGTFYYKIPNGANDTDLELAAGHVYTYTIKVNLTGLSVKSEIAPWTSVDKEGSATM